MSFISYSSNVSENTITSSRNTSASLRRRSPAQFSMRRWKELGTFVTPYGLRLNSNKPRGHTRHTSFRFILFSHLYLEITRFEIHDGKPLYIPEASERLLKVWESIRNSDSLHWLQEVKCTKPNCAILFLNQYYW